MTTQATLHDDLVDELRLLVEGLKDRTQRGSGPREFLNGLLRDIYVLEEQVAAAQEQDDAAWLQPFLEAALAKLELGPRVLPAAKDAFLKSARRLSELRERNELVQTLRLEVPRLLDEDGALRTEAKAQLEKSHVIAALKAKRFLKSVAAGPAPEVALAARLLEGLGLHLALARAEEQPGPADDKLRSLANRLEGWLKERGLTLVKPPVGQLADAAKARTVQGTLRAPNVRSGCTAEVATPGFAQGDAVLCRAVVVASAGTDCQVLAAARKVLDGLQDDVARRVVPVLEAAGRTLVSLLESKEPDQVARAGAALDVVGAVLPVAEGPGQKALLAALQADFPGGDVQLLLPAGGAQMAEKVGWEARDLFSDTIPVGTIVKLLRPGMTMGGKLVRPALVQVSQGPPPPGIIDEVLALLPAEDPRGKDLAERLQRARCQAASDAGAQMARELSDLALLVRDDALGEAGRRAARLVLDDPPQQLAGAPGWEAVREFLDANLEALLGDGENGELTVQRLLRPYLQGLRTHEMAGVRLRSLGESLGSILILHDESLAATAREWVFGELERLGAEMGTGGHARRLMRTAAKAVGDFYKNQETTPAMELTQALKRAAVRIYPEDPEKLDRCPDPAVFHRLEAVYGRGKRFAVAGAFEPAATTGQPGQPGVTETGAITLSLGAEPQLVNLLRSDLLRKSRLGPACTRLEEQLGALDRERLVGELKGDGGAERTFATKLATLVTAALGECKWQRGDADREALGRLFEVLEQEYHVTVLPGYATHRKLNQLADTHGKGVAVTVKREGARQITIQKLGALYRDELLQPVEMTWGVGPAPAYVEHLRSALPWFAAVLEGKPPKIKLSPGAIEAVKDFESPDAGSVEGVVRSLGVLMGWLVQEEAGEAPGFAKAVKGAPGLEMDFFPLPGAKYSNERLLKAVDTARTPDALDIVRDPAREEGEAIHVEQIAVYKDGKLLSDEPRARFGLKTLPKACEELQKVVDPLQKSSHVLGTVKAQLKGHLNKLALLPEGEGQRGVELACFKALLEARLVDPTYASSPDNALHKAGAYLAQRLEAASLLKIERFQGKQTIAEALQGYGQNAAEVQNIFSIAGKQELAEVRRPLVLLEGTIVQKAFLMKGVATTDDDVLEFDRVLVDTLDRLRGWQEGPGALVDVNLDATQKQIIPRTSKRIDDVREKMFEAAVKQKPILPPETARRDLIRFILDQVYRSEDTLSLLDDKSYRGVFGDLVFRDVVFRSAGTYLSNKFGTSIDTSVVEGADIQALTGKFSKETTGPKPKTENQKVWSVVVPCYMQNGVTIRPATVRVGVY